DHMIIPSRRPVEAARQLAGLLDVPWSEDSPGPFAGPFTPVYVSDSLTLDFASRDTFEHHHVCFRVADEEFDAILRRIQKAGLAYRSSPLGETDMRINHVLGGKGVYWQDMDGHLWEALTISYARPHPTPAGTAPHA